MMGLQEEKVIEQESQKQNNISLFGGEPIIWVKLGIDGIYRFATKKSGCFDLASLSALKNYMRHYGYKYIIVDDNNEPEEYI